MASRGFLLVPKLKSICIEFLGYDLFNGIIPRENLKFHERVEREIT